MTTSQIASIVVAVVVSLVATLTAVKLTTVPSKDSKNFGAVASPDIISPYFSYGGLRHWGYHVNANNASSTVCAMQTPPATTTIASLVVSLTQSGGTAYPVAVGWSTNVNSTSTLIMDASMPTASSMTLTATSGGMEQQFGGAVMEKRAIQPNTWINVLVGSTSPASETGVCTMDLIDVN